VDSPTGQDTRILSARVNPELSIWYPTGYQLLIWCPSSCQLHIWYPNDCQLLVCYTGSYQLQSGPRAAAPADPLVPGRLPQRECHEDMMCVLGLAGHGHRPRDTDGDLPKSVITMVLSFHGSN